MALRPPCQRFLVLASVVALIGATSVSCLSAGVNSGLEPESAQKSTPMSVELPTGLGLDHLPVQWITKMDYSGPEGDFVMSLIFRVENPERFSIQAKDRLGRTWWDLTVSGQRALALLRREETFCTYQGAVEIAALPLGPLEFTVLPSLILGRLPFEPTGRFHRGEGQWSVQDDRERTWFARLDRVGVLESWTLLEDDLPAIWWTQQGGLSVLSAREHGLQLRWRNSRVSVLGGTVLPLEPPPDYREDCSQQPTPP